MRKVKRMLCGLAILIAAPATFAQGPDLPDPPSDPGGIQGFVEALLDAVRAFVEGLVGSLPI